MQAIYEIVNLSDGRATAYVGSSADVQMRWRDHRKCLRGGTHTNGHLQNAWDKYGEGAFQFNIIEMVGNEDLLIIREEYWLSRYSESGATYNITQIIEGRCRHSKETRHKIREGKRGKKRAPFSEVWRRRLSLAGIGNQRAKGFKHTRETRLKVSKAGKGKPKSKEHNRKNSEAHEGKKLSEETKRKISAAHKGKKLSREHRRKIRESCKDVNAKPYPGFRNELTGEHIPAGINLSEMCRERGLKYDGMSAVKRGKRLSYEGWVLSNYEK